MRTKNLLTSIDKIAIPKYIEDDIWQGVTENKTKKIKKRNRIRYQIAACIAVLSVSLMFSNSVKAFVYNLGTELFNYLSSSQNYNVQNIGESGLNSPVTMSKDDITITINQCIFSDSEIFFDYSVTADNFKQKVRYGGKAWSNFDIYNNEGNKITNHLFTENLGAESIKSVDTPELQKTVKDKNTVEFVDVWSGNTFLYKDKTLKYKIWVEDGSKRTEFTFEITVDKLYPEKSIKLNGTSKDNVGNDIIITGAKSTFSKIIIFGSWLFTDEGQFKVVDSTGEALKLKGFRQNTINGEFVFELTRKNTNDTDNYTLQFYDTGGNLISQMPISFDAQ